MGKADVSLADLESAVAFLWSHVWSYDSVPFLRAQVTCILKDRLFLHE